MRRFLFLVILFSSELIFAQFPNYLVDSIVVKRSKDTVFVCDYNAWEQCAFKLDYSLKIVDSVITISQVDIAKDMTTCYGYHNFVFPIVGLSSGKYRIDIYRDCLYRENKFIKSFRFEYVISGVSNKEEIPNKFMLYNAYPNPFNPTTTITYELLKQDNVKINIYDVSGKLVKELVNREDNAGKHSVVWNGKNNNGKQVSSGNYFYQIMCGDFVQAKKMILLK